MTLLQRQNIWPAIRIQKFEWLPFFYSMNPQQTHMHRTLKHYVQHSTNRQTWNLKSPG